MNTNAISVLSKIRTALEGELEGRNLQNAHLTEAEQTFCTEAKALIAEAGFEVEGFDLNDPDGAAEALELVAEEEGGDIAKQVSKMLAPAIVEAAGPVIATVPSESNPSKSYEIRLGKDGNVYCNCPAWKYQKIPPADRTCKHLKGLSKQLAQVAGKMGKQESAHLAGTLGEILAEVRRSEVAFVAEASGLLQKAGFELEGFEEDDTEAMVEALLAARDEDETLAESIDTLLRPYLSEDEDDAE